MGKYEDALERARQGKPIDEVFPELKDEWIRKALITIVKRAFSKYGAKCNGDEIGEEDLLAYLEKQKEQKPFTPKFRVGDVMRTKQEAAEGITDGLPVIVSVDNLYYRCTNELISISNQEEYEFPPMNRRQKPTELERLEKLREMTKEIREAYERGVEVGRAESKQEWSEEDEKMRQHIISDLREFKDCETDKDLISDYEDEIAWLKALRPHWKPSEEQMIALHKAAQESPIIKENGNYLYDLYDDLRKLM